MNTHRILACESGAAAAEMVLVLPMLLALMFGGFEAGNFVWTQHKLVEGVRDGARYAARMNINDVCGGDSTATQAKVRLITRTGQVANASAPPRVPGWADNLVTVTFNCNAFVSTGIYTDLGDTAGPAGPIVTVAATNVPYPSLFQRLGYLDGSIRLSAKSNAAVTGL